jgi:hypothetical protein
MENQLIDQIKAVLSPANIKITNETSRFDLFDPVRPYRLYFNGYHDFGSYSNSMDKLVFDFKATLSGTKLLRFCVLEETEVEFNSEDAKKNY